MPAANAASANKVGPGLYGVIGRQAGTHEGFAYSDAMKAHGKPWTYADISHFITHPKEEERLLDPAYRAELIDAVVRAGVRFKSMVDSGSESASVDGE